MIDITFKLSKEEFVKGYTSHPELKQKTSLIVLLSGIAFLAGLIGFIYYGIEENTMINSFLFFFGFFFVFFGYRQKLSYNKFYVSNPNLQGDIHYIFSDRAIKNIGENFNIDTNWNKIYQVLETSEYLYIYLNKAVMYVIPKRAFTSEKLKAVKEILQSQKDLKKKMLD